MNPQTQAGLELDPLILAALQANLGDNSATSGTQQAPDGQEDDRKAICNHPLFPILAMIFEKCEVSISTKASAFSEARGHLKAESIKQEIAKFAKQTKETTPHYIANEALDSLMVQGIRVLLIHLLELEKVHQLTDNFCDRYISCLRGKTPIEPRDWEDLEDQEQEDPRESRRADDPKLQLEEVNKVYEFMEFLEIIDVPGDLDMEPPEDPNGSENPANVETPANTVTLDDAKHAEFLQVLHKL